MKRAFDIDQKIKTQVKFRCFNAQGKTGTEILSSFTS